MAVKKDVTQEMALERQLQQAQKMEAIGTLTGGIAHDFNNVLQVVMGFSHMMLREEELPESYLTEIRMFSESAGRGAELVKGLIAFSRKAEFKPQPLNLNHRLIDLRKMLERTIRKTIDIDLLLAKDLTSIDADATQMDQIPMNLAVNARDAMPKGGKLIFSTSNITLDDQYVATHIDSKPGPQALLKISDTGCGMDSDTLERIFELFHTTKKTGEGTGLGLAMVHGIVKQQRGHITCESEPGKGTTFRIYFPALAYESHQGEPGAHSMPKGGTETILMVDDEEMVRKLCVRIFTKAGYRVIEASNGQEALDVYKARRDEIALVILDLMMPEMDGMECLEALQTVDASVKVVIASGYVVNGAIDAAICSGAKAAIQKPYDIQNALKTVREVLDSGDS
ncbi:MAG: response regulator [Desulfomonilaceae bacterium]